MGAGRGRVAQHRRQRAGVPRLADLPGQPGPPRVAVVERGRVLPALPEGDRQVPDGRAADLQLHVVPGRAVAVAPVHRHRLGVAQVALVVAAPVAQVDPAHEGDVLVLPVGVADQDQLLVLAARSPDPLVEQDLAAGLVDDLADVQVLLLLEVGQRSGGSATGGRAPGRPARPARPGPGPARCPRRRAARRCRRASRRCRPGRRGRERPQGGQQPQVVAAPCTNGSTRLPSVQARPSLRRRSMSVAGLPRSDRRQEPVGVRDPSGDPRGPAVPDPVGGPVDPSPGRT